MNILVTGADGFIGKNLCVHLARLQGCTIFPFTREQTATDLRQYLQSATFIFHLAGTNRATETTAFRQGNIELTQLICETLCKQNKSIPILYTSSTQAALHNPYGESKRAAEEILERYATQVETPLYIYRLPNVFGKWAKPHYNSVVATFCHQIARDLPIEIHDATAELSLVYVDDLIKQWMNVLKTNPHQSSAYYSAEPLYTLTVGALAQQLTQFRETRTTLVTDRVGHGLTRALYATYVSNLPTEAFSYPIPQYRDNRGRFVEMLKTQDSGQISFFTAPPGVTRGDHYHHSKTEKFLVLQGQAQFRFRHIISQETYDLKTSGTTPEIVETVPGWVHEITNIGEIDMIVLLWSNEIFDPDSPDTYSGE